LAFAADPNTLKECEERVKTNEIYSKMGFIVEPISDIARPFDLNTPYGKLNSGNLFRELSGYYCNSVHGHALIYFSTSGITVLSSGYERIYPPNKLKEAFNDYERIIKKYKLDPK
jgi:hypothetical protein